MKKRLFNLILLLTVIAWTYPKNTHAQQHEIAIQYQWLGESVFAYEAGAGGPGYDLKKGDNFGLEYRYFFKPWLVLQTGITYQQTIFTISSNLPPDIPKIISETSLNVLAVPIMGEVHFLKYFFANTGLVFTIDTHNDRFDKQTGLGFAIGIGGQYNISKRVRLYINPLISQYNTSSLSSREQKLTQAGIKGGIAYKF